MAENGAIGGGHSGFLALKLCWDCFLLLLLILSKYFSSTIYFRHFRTQIFTNKFEKKYKKMTKMKKIQICFLCTF